ncbi:MAG: hypothetical protein ACRESZ_03720, partial [Methylococcales bacterium]
FLITTTSCFNNMKQLDNGVRFDPKADSLFAIKPDRSICCQQYFVATIRTPKDCIGRPSLIALQSSYHLRRFEDHGQFDRA